MNNLISIEWAVEYLDCHHLNQIINALKGRGSLKVKICVSGHVSYTIRNALPVAFQGCMTLNLFMELLERYFTLKGFKY